MITRLSAACAATAFCVLGAGAANATVPITATLAAPVAQAARIVAGGAVWHCEGSTCVAGSADRTTMSVDTCKDLARHAGRVTAFSSQLRTLDAASLDRCNAAAR